MMTMKGLGLLMAVLLLPLSTQAQQIGRVLSVRGEVTARAADGSVRTLSRGQPLQAGDTLLTADDAFLQVKLIDDAKLSLDGDSEFRFDKYVVDDDPATADSTVMSLVRGCFRTISGRVGAGPLDEHRIDTPVATITIRGTFHSGRFDGVTLYTATYEGGTTVTNEQGALDVGIGGGLYDYTLTRAGSAPEGLLTPPSFTHCGEPGTEPVPANLLPPPSAVTVLPIGTSFAPSRPAGGRQDP